MTKHIPRRASKKRWLEGAPSYILDCFDDPRTCDRYTVMFTGEDFLLHSDRGTRVQYLGMSGSPEHPQGFSQWGELHWAEAANFRYASGRRRIRWMDLPENIRKHVEMRAKQ